MDKVSRFSFGLEAVDIDEIKTLLKRNQFREIHSLLEKLLCAITTRRFIKKLFKP
jgi:predicted transcriptional regulator